MAGGRGGRVLTEEQADLFDGSVAALAEDAFCLLERLVSVPSTLGYEEPAQAIVAEELERLGFVVSGVQVPDSIGGHPAAGVPQVSYDGRRDVLGRWLEGKPALLFNGHIDVVPVDEAAWRGDPYRPRRVDGWLVGRGSGDMKGGIAMALLALRALSVAVPSALDVPLAFLSVVEEECTGNGTLAAVLEGVTAEAVVLPEPSDLGALLAGIGVLWVDVELMGAGGHAHVADELATPVSVLGRLVSAFEQMARSWSAEVPDTDFGPEQPYTVNVGTIRCGEWRSSVASRARLGVRFGYPRSWTATEALQRVVEVTRRFASGARDSGAGSGIEVRARSSGFRAEGYGLEPDHWLVELLGQCHRSAHGQPLRRFGLNSTTDARFYLNQAKVPALCYGPVARNLHGAEEAVDLSSVVAGARTLGRLIARAGELGDSAAQSAVLSGLPVAEAAG